MMKLIPVLCLALVAATPAPALDTAALKAAAAAKLEQMAAQMVPQKELDEMLGFFGPVSKKYLPVFRQFNREYLEGTNKLATVRKYLPKAQAALDEAKAMKVPAKYEAKKTEYVGRLETFMSLVGLTARFGK